MKNLKLILLAFIFVSCESLVDTEETAGTTKTRSETPNYKPIYTPLYQTETEQAGRFQNIAEAQMLPKHFPGRKAVEN
ncbi:MAG: hypothetical protein Ta2B_28130 [Termitinemataceae bacterium]|nr:MAG: hypothetical protein Ta2B_28130 [Termitinemataceae bacterium]